jgi:hypothetical protein
MEANELRIGNNLDGGMVSSVQDGYYTNQEGLSVLIRDAKPILLTNIDWRKRVGFKKRLYEKSKPSEGCYYVLNVNKGVSLIIEDGEDYAYLDIEISINDIVKYYSVHEVQNLYYSLNKKELCVTNY